MTEIIALWIPTDQLIQLAWRRIASLKVDLSELRSIVATNDKQRYTLKYDPAGAVRAPSTTTSSASTPDSTNWRIRAAQGHSITTVSSEHIFKPILLTDADCPNYVVHGTEKGPWLKIQQSGGLKPMARNHIHFATGLPEKMPKLNEDFQSLSKPRTEREDGVISGMRHDCAIVIWVDLKRSLEGGVKWWRSENGVILTEGLGEPKMLAFEWFQWVETRGQGKPGKVLYGSKVESAEVTELETRMNRLGVGLGDREGVSRNKAEGGEGPQEKVSGGRALPEKEATGDKKAKPDAAIKDHWDD